MLTLRRGASLVIGLGVDLVETERVERALARWGDRFVNRLMSAPEAGRLPPEGPERVLSVALAIAGKEAASKAIGTGWTRGVRWRDVVVEAGTTASVGLFDRAAEVARALGWKGRTWARLEVRGGLVVAEVRLLA